MILTGSDTLVDLRTLINLCDDKEINIVLDAIALEKKGLFASWLKDHKELFTPPVKAEKVPEKEPLTEEEIVALSEVTLDIIKPLAGSHKHTNLEDVVAGVMLLGYERKDILNSMDSLLDRGIIYEPCAGKISVI